MYSESKSAKSKFLKRKIKQDLQEIAREESVKRILKGPSDFITTPLLSGLSSGQIIDSIQCSHSSPQSHSSGKLNSVELGDNPFEQADHASSSESSELPEFLSSASEYFFSSDSENSVCETEITTDSLTCEESSCLKQKLIDWARLYGIRGNALSALLKILREEKHPELPSDSRTLLKTIRKSNVIYSDDFETAYFGIVEGLHKQDLKKLCGDDKKVVLKINIDGLPISKSTGAQFWPILCQILSKHVVSPPPFMVACYYGKSKPKSVHQFLEPFIKELHKLQIEGFDYLGNHYDVFVHCVICDAPARALVKCIKGHGGFYGCEKCIQKGTYVNSRVVFLENEAEKRSDISFRLKMHENHHTGTSPFLSINIGLVSQMPLDYMHLVVLGAMRKLLLYWMRKGDRSVRIGVHQIALISNKLGLLARHMPSEFSRRPRSLTDIDRYKATELRQILLYTGPIVLRNVLPDDIYNHFLLLHVSISILANKRKSLNQEHVTYAEQLLKLFVQQMREIYKEESIVYNIHNLIHLADDVRSFGCLDNFSCFPFENFLFQIKNELRTSNRPLAQLCRRMSERPFDKERKIAPVVKLSYPHNDGPCFSISGKQFKQVIFNNCKINTSNIKDSYVQLADKKVAKVLNIVQTSSGTDPDTIVLICDPFPNYRDYYTHPCGSKKQGIYKIGRNSNQIIFKNLKSVMHKCLVSEELRVAVALNHEIY